VEKKLGYILNNFRPSLLDFEGFFCKPKELLETFVNIFFFSFPHNIDHLNDIILLYTENLSRKTKILRNGNLSGESTSLYSSLVPINGYILNNMCVFFTQEVWYLYIRACGRA